MGWNVALQAPLFIARTVPPGRDVVVMTSNLLLGGADPQAVVDAVRTHGVDVLMIEELTATERAALRDAGLDALLPHAETAPADGGSGTGLWSRFPLREARIDHDFGFELVTARLAIPGAPVAPTAVALHVYGPYPSSQFPGWRDDMARLPAYLRSLPSAAPVLVGGDFNATPDTAQFRDLLRGGYADAAEQAGAGITASFPADRWYGPLIAIDHVLTRDAVAHSADTLSIPGSDHRALLVTVRLPG